MKKVSFLIPFLCLALLFSSCNNMGKSVKHGHVEGFYKDGITQDEAQKAVDVMYNLDIQANNPQTEKNFQLVKKDGVVHFRMPMEKDNLAAITDQQVLAMGNYISTSVFNGASVDVDLCDKQFKTVRTVPFQKISDAPTGEGQ